MDEPARGGALRYDLAGIRVAELWRYPVKSMAGERLDRVAVGSLGVPGDRCVQVHGPHGLISARTHPELLRLGARLGPDGSIHVDGAPWDSAVVGQRVRRAAGASARLAREEDARTRFDILPLLVATDGAIASFGQDGRRLRPNIVLSGVPGLTERSWEGKLLVIGQLVVLLHSLRSRCIVTTYDPDTLVQDLGVLRDIGDRFGGTLALNSAVMQTGAIAVGDPAAIVDPPKGSPGRRRPTLHGRDEPLVEARASSRQTSSTASPERPTMRWPRSGSRTRGYTTNVAGDKRYCIHQAEDDESAGPPR